MEHKAVSRFLTEHILSSTAYWICSGHVLTKLTEYVGLPLGVSGIVTQLTSTLLGLQLAGGFWFSRTAHRHRYLLVSNLLWMAGLSLLFFTVLLPPGAAGPAMIALFLSAQIAYQLCVPAQTAWQVDAAERAGDSRFYTLRESAFMFVYSALLCAAQLMIAFARSEAALRYSFVLIGALLVLLLGACVPLLFRLPPPQDGGRKISVPQLLEPLRSRRYRDYILINTVWGLYGVFVNSFAVLYAVRILHIDFFVIMLWSTLGNFMRALCAGPAARIAGRIGWRKTLCLFAGLGVLISAGWRCAAPENIGLLFPLLTLLAPVPVGAMGQGMFRLQAACAPAPMRSVFFSVSSAVSGTTCFAGTLVCSALTEALSRPDGFTDLRNIFLIGAVFGVATVILLGRPSREEDGSARPAQSV